MSDDWIPTDEATKISNYNTEYLRWLVRNKKIKGRKFGFALQVSKSGLIAYMREAEKSGDRRRGGRRLQD